MSLDKLDQKLQAEQPALSAAEQSDLWQRISPQISAPVLVTSPYTAYLSFIHSRTMTSFIIALILILGAGGTVAVSEAAKPGDILFPIERAAEKTRLAFAGDERAAELRADYATQRWEELLEIIEEEGTVSVYDNASSTTASSTGTIISFSAEADVFTDITVVKVEANDQKRIFTTATTTKTGVIAEIARRYDLASSTIEAGLDFEIEDRASRPSERGVMFVDNTGEERISKAVNVLLDLLAEVDNENARNGLLMALLTQIDNVSVKGRENNDQGNDNRVELRTEDSRIKIKDNRIEVREDGYRLRIDKDGEVKVKQDDDKDDDKDKDDDDDSQDEDDDNYESYSIATSTATTSSKNRLEVEADVYTDITEVKVEVNGVKTKFVTLAKTREAVAQEVAVMYKLEKSLVLAVLDLEIEDGSSLGNDAESNDDESKDEDEEEEKYEDEDEDKDAEEERAREEDDEEDSDSEDDEQESEEDDDDQSND